MTQFVQGSDAMTRLTLEQIGERTRMILKLHRQGVSKRAIGKQYGLTGERVGQIIKQCNQPIGGNQHNENRDKLPGGSPLAGPGRCVLCHWKS
jgi:hypothetical protein